MSGSSKPRLGLGARTTVYVLSFGLGSLLFAGGLAFGLKSLAEGALTRKTDDKAPKGEVVEIIGETPASSADKKNLKAGPKAASKARPPRANEAPKEEPAGDSEQPL